MGASGTEICAYEKNVHPQFTPKVLASVFILRDDAAKFRRSEQGTPAFQRQRHFNSQKPVGAKPVIDFRFHPPDLLW
jgi:hypothetical protein